MKKKKIDAGVDGGEVMLEGICIWYHKTWIIHNKYILEQCFWFCIDLNFAGSFHWLFSVCVSVCIVYACMRSLPFVHFTTKDEPKW